ncbi:MAG: hypothetical protein NVV59_00970 [Chitinophagaceae bacterium]|nr:hypothetical protein [Chitinophagaceae bacterium]
MGFLYSFVASESFLEYGERLPISLLESLLYLISHMFLSYYLIYFVIPRFLLKEKYWKSAILVVIGFLIVAAMAAFTTIFIIRPIRVYFFPDEYIIPPIPYVSAFIYHSLPACVVESQLVVLQLPLS